MHTQAHVQAHTEGVDTLVEGWEVTNLVGQEFGNHLKVLRVELQVGSQQVAQQLTCVNTCQTALSDLGNNSHYQHTTYPVALTTPGIHPG